MTVDVSRTAPVIESATVEVSAPAEIVWAVLTDFERWPRWNPSVTRMEFSGSLDVGTTFRWVGGGARISSRIEEVEPSRRVVWSGRTLGIAAVHAWSLTPCADGTRVFTEESFAGFLPRVLPGMMRRMLGKALQEGLVALKAEAESRHRVDPD